MGQWRAIPPDAWNTLVVIDEKGGIVRGHKPAAARLYGVVVAPQRQEVSVIGQSSEVEEAASAGRRRRKPEDDALRKNRVEAVLATAKALWPDRGARPPTTEMAKDLITRKKAQGYAPDTLRKILSGRYGPAKQLGISLDW